MASKIRRPRGTATSTTGLYVNVEVETKQTFDRLTAQTGASQWALIEAMIAHTAAELDAGRTPDWLPRAAPDNQAAMFDRSEVTARQSA